MKKLLCLSALIVYIFACCPCSTTSPPTPVAEPPTAQPPTALPEPTDTPVPPTEAPTSTPAPPLLTDIPTYHIVDVEDISVANAVRFRATVTTEFPISVEQVNGLCQKVIGDLEPFNAAVVFVYDTHSVLSWGYSIAKCEYAPNGVWANADNAQTGDYSTHKFTYEYQPKVNDPQAALSERPTEQEHNLCQQWDKLAFELLSKSDDAAAAENLAYEQVAEENGVSVQAVKDAVLKCEAWTWR